MAFDTYANLKTAIANFLARDDLTTQIPDFISLAEARMSRELDTRSQEKRANANTVSGTEFITLPTDLRQLRLVRLNTSPITVLQYKSPDVYYSTYNDASNGKPVAYTIIGTELGMRPIPDAIYQTDLVYSEDLSALTDSNTSNTILSRHPDAYLYGSLAAANQFLMDEARANQYDALFSRAMEEIKTDTQNSKYASGSLAMSSA